MKEFSKSLQVILLVSVYAIATICTILFEFYIPKVKKFLYKQPIKGVLTNWQITHLLTRIIVGFVAPDFWLWIISVDIGWEVFECLEWGNHNWGDLIYNGIGLGIGIGINKLMTAE